MQSKTYEWFFHDYTDDSVNHFASLDALKSFIRDDGLTFETVAGEIGVQCTWNRGAEQHMCQALASPQGLATELNSCFAILETPQRFIREWSRR